MIRFGANTFLWTSPFRTRDLHLVEKARAFGFDVMEIALEAEGDLDYALARQAYERCGMKCSISSVMGPGRDPAHEDEALQKAGVAYLKHLVDAAVALDAPMIGGPHYAAVGRTWQAGPEQRKRDLERCARNLKEVARYAEDKGVTLAIEPLNRFETSFINLTAQALELLQMVDSPRMKLMMDTFHANIEEKSLGANENDRGTPGTGHLPWAEIAASLKRIGFDGTLVIESFSTEVKEIARAAAVWRPLAPSQDELARDGLAFLKRLMA